MVYLSDRIVHLTSFIGYLFGSGVAKLYTHKMGPKSRIHLSVRYWWPSHIEIGRDCEIRDGTFLDARSPKRISIQIGDYCRIKDTVGLATYGGEIQLGKNVLIGRCSTIFGHGGVYIGDNSMLGPNTSVLSGNHLAYLNGTPFQSQGTTKERIFIGNNVWIGANTTILGASYIAPDVVIAAGAVVRGRLESGWVYAGVPAKPIKPLPTKRPEDLTAYYRSWDLFTYENNPS